MTNIKKNNKKLPYNNLFVGSKFMNQEGINYDENCYCKFVDSKEINDNFIIADKLINYCEINNLINFINTTKEEDYKKYRNKHANLNKLIKNKYLKNLKNNNYNYQYNLNNSNNDKQYELKKDLIKKIEHIVNLNE